MFLKRSNIFLFAFLSFFAFRAEAYLEPLSPQSFNALYNLAARGEVSAINNARSRGMDIDSVNANGDTGLCVAAKYKNRVAFRSFLQSGANPSHPCTWEISGYRDFLNSVIQNPVKNMDTAVPANKGMITGMSFTTKALIGAGIIAAGAGTAIALGGGGGGGGKDVVDSNCTERTGSTCTACKDGYVLINGWCYKHVDCGTHGTQTGAGCKCDTGYDASTNCSTCAKGYGRGSTGECVGVEVDKIIGNADNMNTNYNDSDITINNNKYTTIYGLFYDADNTPADLVIDENSFANGYYEIESTTYQVEVTDYKRDPNNNVYWYQSGEDTPSGYIDVNSGSNLAYNDLNEVVGTAYLISGVYTVKNGDDILGQSQTETTTEDVDYLVLDKSASLNITNDSDSVVYGLYSPKVKKIYNVYVSLQDSGILVSDTSSLAPASAISSITINNTGNGNVYGIFGNNAIYSGDFQGTADDSSQTGNVFSSISITNQGDGSAYGIYNAQTSSSSTSTDAAGIYHQIKANSNNTLFLYSVTHVENTNGKGNTYGLYSYNAITNSGIVSSLSDKGDAYGLYGNGATITNDTVGSLLNSVTAQSATGNACGAYIKDGTITNGRIITATTTAGQGNAYGIYAVQSSGKQTSVVNNSGITVTSAGGDAYGIYNKDGAVTNTTAIYPINVTAPNGTAYGIYSDGGSVTNSGHIYVYGSSQEKTYGIYATNNAKITNTGEFKFLIGLAGSATTANQYLTWEDEEAYCTNCNVLKTPDGGYAVYLTGGAKFENAGILSTMSALNLGSQGVSITTNGNFSAASISGNLSVANDVVSSGFENTYVLQNAINADDTSELTLTSGSPLFNASLNGTDIVLTKKDFADVLTTNSSVAAFLEQNYALQNDAALFKDLKDKTNLSQIRNAVSALTAQNVLSRFGTEDLLVEKELNFDISEKMFHLKDNSFSLTGTVKPQMFSGKNTRTQYALSGQKTENTGFGVGLSISDINSYDGNHSNKRVSKHIQLLAPFRATDKGFAFLITPKIGYAYGTYNRNGYNNQSYDGQIERRMAAVSNEVRYPIRLGAFELSPAAEFNFGAYQTKLKEDVKSYSLSSEKNNTYSVETGFGAYLSTQKELSKTSRFEFMTGASLYHEFANPYELTLSMNNMNGRFKITDEKRRNDYIVLRSKFSYDVGNLSLYGSFLSYIDSEYRTRADLGFKYAF